MVAIAVIIAVAVFIAVITSDCKLVGYITRYSIADNHSLGGPAPWGVPLALRSTLMLANRFFHLIRVGI